MTLQLYQHQVDDLEAMRRHSSFALWHEVGSGKSFPCILRMLEILFAQPQGTGVVIAPVPLLHQIERDFYRVLEDPLCPIDTQAHFPIRVLSGSSNVYDRDDVLTDPPRVLIVNIEFFPKVSDFLLGLAQQGRLPVMWVDEAHILKGFRGFRSKHGVRSKAVQTVARHVPIRLASSGSPVVNPNSPDIWGIYHYLDPTIFGPTLWKFEQEFYYNVVQGQPFKKLVLKDSMKAEMSRRMYLCARRLLKRDLPIDFPERVTIEYPVDMPPKLAEEYNTLAMQALLELEGKVITRPQILARLMTLQQMASGFLIVHPEDDYDSEVMILDTSHKDNAVMSILDSIGDEASTIIWAVFTHEIDRLCEMVTKRRGDVVRVDGKVTGLERDCAVQRFQAGEVKTMVAHPQAAGVGLNLQVAGHDIRYSRSYRPVDYIQTLGRNQRAGAQFHTRVTSHEIYARQTVDEKIFRALIEKQDLSGEITLDFLRPEERNR